MPTRLDAVDAATAPAQVTADVSLKFVGGNVFHLHDRLEQDRFALLETIFHGEDRGELERQFVRIDVVVAAVNDVDFDVDYGIATEDAIQDGFLDTLLNRGDVLTRNNTANNLVFDDQARATTSRTDIDFDVTVLTAA